MKAKVRNNALFRGVRVRGMSRKCVSIARRCGAFLCAVLLVVHLALFPVRARATAGALAAVAGVTVLGAYLMASGVYPYISEAGQSFSEWTSDNLQPLLDKYNAYLISIGKSYQIALNGATPTIKGYMTQGVIMVANDVWGKLREFVQWIQSEYALTDNQLGVQVGSVSSNGAVPVFSYTPTYDDLIASGLYMGRWTNTSTPIPLFFGVNQDGVYAGIVGNAAYMATLSPGATGWMTNPSYSSKVQVLMLSNTARSSTGVTIYYVYQYPFTSVADRADGIPVYQSAQGFFDALAVGIQSDFVGVTVDTTAVTLPEALPDGTPWGGLAVEGTGAAASPAVVEDVIGQAIAEREKPVVRPVEVEIGTGTEVDSETGEVTENPVVVTPSDVPLAVSDYALPASIITVFPFSLPWDLVRVLEALRATPEPISFTLSFPHYGLTNGTGLEDEDFSFQVVFPPPEISQNEAFSDFMSWFRNIELIVMCVAVTWGIVSFIRRG